jgi:hypothetical protein
VNRVRDWLFKGAREACPASDKPQTAPDDNAGARLELSPLFMTFLALTRKLDELVANRRRA